jgi:hypothetical protein
MMIVKYIANPKRQSSKASRIGSLLDYISAEGRTGVQKAEYVATSGSFLGSSFQAWRAEMMAVAVEAKRSKDPVDHWLLSWKEGEQPTMKQCDQAVEILKGHLGMRSEHLAVYALHRNTENYHLHVALNRVEPNSFRVADKGWCIDKAHKAVAEIVHVQGWEQEVRARYVTDGVGNASLVERSRARQPSSKARDQENATGEKSCERFAIEDAPPILSNANSWEQAHQQLAAYGMRYELKGSGAVLWVNDQPVKVSVIGREFSKKYLEDRWGAFQSCRSNVIPQEVVHPVEAAGGVDVKLRYEYRRVLESRRNEKDAAQMKLRAEHRAARDVQAASFRSERTELYRDGQWSGAALNVARSLLATDHAKRKAHLLEQRKRERDALRLQFGRRLTFEQFLVANGAPDLAQAWRYRDSRVAVAALHGEGDEQSLKRDIRDYRALADSTTGIHYFRINSTEIVFTDQGKRINVWKTNDEAAVLAALQLGAQKWRALTVTGTPEFRLLCAEIAQKHGIKINNPELQRTGSAPADRLQSPIPIPVGMTSTEIAYHSHKRDILNRLEVSNPSRLDWMIVVRLRVTGHDLQEIADALLIQAKEGRPEGERNWSNYAERTAEAVFGPRGDRESATNQPRANAWAQVEGRDLGRRQFPLRQSSQRAISKQRERGTEGIGE